MEDKRIKVVIVGHVDHGKSTLIGRLLYDSGSLPEGIREEIEEELAKSGKPVEFAQIIDHLEEERVEEKTIDTAQSFFNTAKRGYVIIDAPGHKEYIKNMITGASQAEVAILVVSAVDGMEEQTRRHAYLLRMLGLKNVIIAINKMDAVDYRQDRFEEVSSLASDFLGRLDIRASHVIPISARWGDNISKPSAKLAWYAGASVLDVLDQIDIKKDHASMPMRFPVQDIYTINGKEIIVGRITSGKVKVGDEVIIVPGKVKTKIGSIEIFWKIKEWAEAGESIGITLEDKLDVRRGDIICSLNHPARVLINIDANLFWLSQEPLRPTDPLTIRCATQEGYCHVNRIKTRINSSTLELVEESGNTLEESEAGRAIISLTTPLVFEDFNEIEELGRFILERNGQICAGGTVVGIV